jgi:hypothetical protein
LLALSGPRSRVFRKGERLETGAFANLLQADRDPVANIEPISDPAKNQVAILMDGKIRKNQIKM